MYPIRPNSQRAKLVINIFYAVLVCSIISLVLLSTQWYLYHQVLNDYSFESETLTTVSGIDNLFNIINLGVTVATMIIFIQWFRRAYYNLNMANPGEASLSEGWAAGAWFVPILNWFRPYQIMREIWTGTQTAMPHRYPELRPAGLVGAWWALYLAMGFGGIAIYVIAYNFTMENLTELFSASILLEIISFIAAIVTMQMVKTTAAFEEELWNEAQNPSDSVFAITAAEV